MVRARQALTALLLLAALIQLVDLVQDSAHGRLVLVPAVATLGAIFLVAGVRLARRAPEPL